MAKAAAAMTKVDGPFGVALFRVVVAVSQAAPTPKQAVQHPGPPQQVGSVECRLEVIGNVFCLLLKKVFFFVCFFCQGTWGNFLQQKMNKLEKLLRCAEG